MNMHLIFFFLVVLFQKTITKDYLEYYDYQPSYTDRLFISQEKDLKSSKFELATKFKNILPIFLIGFFGSLLISVLLNTVSMSPCYLWILFKASGHICIGSSTKIWHSSRSSSIQKSQTTVDLMYLVPLLVNFKKELR